MAPRAMLRAAKRCSFFLAHINILSLSLSSFLRKIAFRFVAFTSAVFGSKARAEGGDNEDEEAGADAEGEREKFVCDRIIVGFSFWISFAFPLPSTSH